jgi:hypothetical protein
MSKLALAEAFLGEAIQICTVTRDYRKAIAGFLELGIGPWRVYTFGPETVSEMTYRGRPSPHVMKVCLAMLGRMEWEIIQPVAGPSIYDDFLARHGEGAHHIAVRCAGASWAGKVAGFEARGFPVVQSGSWLSCMPYAYFDTEAATGTIFEIFDEPPDFTLPEPEEWWPAKSG